MITYTELVGGEDTGKKNTEGYPILSTGFIQKYLPEEYSYDFGEGLFLADLCCYLLSGKEEPDFNSWFKISRDRFFLEKFVFYNIKKEEFLKEIEKHQTNEFKVKAICELIDSRIRVKNKKGIQERFHDFYINYWQGFDSNSPENEQIIFCQNVRALCEHQKELKDKIVPYNREQFVRLCEKYPDVIKNNKPIPPTISEDPIKKEEVVQKAIEDLKKATEAYVEHLIKRGKNYPSMKDMPRQLYSKGLILGEFKKILDDSKPEEMPKKLKEFLTPKNVEVLSARRYALRGVGHAAAVFFKTLLLCLPLILDVVTLGGVKWFSPTHKSCTERVLSYFFEIKGAKFIEQVNEAMRPLSPQKT